MRVNRKFLLVSLGVIALLALAGYLTMASIRNQLWPPQPRITLNRQPVCALASFPELRGVRLHAASRESEQAPHCKVAGTIDTEINFELLLPDAWNGKFAMGGGGGFVGSVVNMALLYGALHSGYATVGTDTGHSAHPIDGSWALNNPERLENFGHRAVHLVAVTAKQLLADYYGMESLRNLFIGCSRGGGQALMEAQRYPEDFDGIVAGAPALNWTLGIAANAIQINQAMFPDSSDMEEALVTPGDLSLIASRYLEQCDSLDGLEDGILMDPRACSFDVQSLQCAKDQASDCLSTEKVAAMQKIYQGPRDAQGSMWVGFPLGGELSRAGIGMWLTGGLKYAKEMLSESPGNYSPHPAPLVPNASFGFGNGVMKYMIFNDPDWDYASYDFENFREIARPVADILNATAPDLSVFRERGGKLLLYHGWSDMALSALGTIGYYEEVLASDASAADDVRLYLLPGVNHCFGGAGPSFVNYLAEMDRWLESGQAPRELEIHWLKSKFLPWGSRLACPYPQQVRYTGGDPRDAGSFSCVSP